MSSKIFLALILVALAVLILWRLSSRSVPPISFNEKAMLLRHGECVMALPLMRKESKSLVADVLTIHRTFATLYDGAVVVDERITMPANYTFGKALSALLSMIFDASRIREKGGNSTMALFSVETKDGMRSFDVLAVFKGKNDLELLYPLNESLAQTVKSCLIDGKKPEGPVVINRVVDEKAQKLPLTDWNEKLFDLEIIVNKDM